MNHPTKLQDQAKDPAPVPPHNVVEQERMAKGQPPHRGEQLGKRNGEERNDAQSQPASTEGMPHPPRGY